MPSVLPPLHYIDSPFQLQEYLSLLIRQDPHNVERIVALPQPSSEVTRTFAEEQPAALQKGKGKDESAFAPEEEPQSVDTDVWVYEQLRRIVLDFTTPWLTSLQKECDRKTRPKTCDAMNADDWMYLCASHGEEKQCCAIDYIVHTLDGTTALLNSARHFPSRTYIPTTSLRHFGSVSRRLSRIFVHAYEHHSDVFEACEVSNQFPGSLSFPCPLSHTSYSPIRLQNETSLYARFLALVQTYDLIAVDSLPLLGAKARPAISAKEQEEESIGRNVSAEEKSEVPKKILLRSSTNDADNLNRSASNASTRTAVRIGTQEDQSGALDRRDLSPDEAPADAKDIDDEDEL